MSRLIRIYAVYEPSHLDLPCVTFSISSLRINFFPSNILLKKKSRRQMSSEIWHRKVHEHDEKADIVDKTSKNAFPSLLYRRHEITSPFRVSMH